MCSKSTIFTYSQRELRIRVSGTINLHLNSTACSSNHKWDMYDAITMFLSILTFCFEGIGLNWFSLTWRNVFLQSLKLQQISLGHLVPQNRWLWWITWNPTYMSPPLPAWNSSHFLIHLNGTFETRLKGILSSFE